MRHFTVWRFDFEKMEILATKHILTNDEKDVKAAVKRMNMFVAKNSYHKFAYLYRENKNDLRMAC
jgi:hypothetical protein